jgi:adenylyltransferase/sulfurtransferase
MGNTNRTTGGNGAPLSPDELERYRRHLVLPDVGIDGQRALKSARVLLVGAGGLGAPSGLYLAAAGVGHIGIVDFDRVDVTNLQRQVTFATGDVGRVKAGAARERLTALNPLIDVRAHPVRLARDNALDIVRDYDIVVDGSDNFATRYLVNDACVILGKPNVYGSVYRFDGQAAVFGVGGGPCYRCLYPDPPAPGAIPSCAEGGVLGALPGIVGAIQANETIKLIVGAGETLAGRLLLLDALTMRFRELRLDRDPACPACGDSPTIRELVDYDRFCGVGGEEKESVTVPEIEPRELKRRLDAGDDIVVVDVREPHERNICHIGGELIPMGELPGRVRELDADREIVVYCRTGRRSAHEVGFLHQWGFDRVFNLRGGLHAWADDVDPAIPKY